MCLIICRNTKANVPNDVLSYNKISNPDGFGIEWRSDKGINARKYGPNEYERFHETLKSIDAKDCEYVAHFRKATHGLLTAEMAHPYQYEDKKEGPVLVFHNGIIDIATAKDESDTYVFVKHVLANLEPRWWRNPTLKWLVESLSAGLDFSL